MTRRDDQTLLDWMIERDTGSVELQHLQWELEAMLRELKQATDEEIELDRR